MTSRQLDEEAIFHTARKIENSEARCEYLEQICAGDAALRSRVEELLEVHEKEQDFLKSSPDPGPTVDPSPLSEGPGHEIGRYRLLQKIGEGGFGVVYMAEQHRPVRRKVALKIIKPGMDTREVVARFEAERQALALMDHPNISRVLDGGATDSGRPYFVMELVKGVPITEYCDANNLPTEDRLKLFVTVCQAVQHAHQKGIIHRDVKPSNILITLHDGQPVVKVIDFGVAKAINQQLTEKTLFTAYGQMVGTPQYMSPEQAEMSGLDVDTRSDVYSLGALLYELLTGTTPLDGERLRTAGYAEMQRIIREEEPPKPSTRLSTLGEKLTIIAKHRAASPERLHKAVKGDLDWIVMKAMEKDRTRRFQTVSNLAADVHRFLCYEPIEARPPSRAYWLRKVAVRHRAVVVTLAAVLISLLIGLVCTAWMAYLAWRANELLTTEIEEKKATLKRLGDAAYAKAVMAALAGEEEESRSSLTTARDAEIPRHAIDVIRALIALNNGEYEETIRLAKELLATASLEQDSQQLAAHALLVPANALSFRWDQAERHQIELGKLTPRTEIDHVLWLHALVLIKPSEVLGALEASPQRLRSPVGLLIRGEARLYEAVQRQDASLLDNALSDFRYAEFLFGENRSLMAWHVAALGHAIEVARQSDRGQEVVRYIAEGKPLAEKLARMNYPLGDFDRWLFLRAAGDVENASKALDNVVKRGSGYCLYLASDCLSRPNPLEAKARLDSVAAALDSEDPFFRIARAHVECDFPNGTDSVRRLVGDLTKDESPIVARHALAALCRVSSPSEIRKRAQTAMTSVLPVDDFWGGVNCIRFLAGEFDEAECLRRTGNRTWPKVSAHFTIAMLRTAARDHEATIEHLRQCVATNALGTFDYELARAYLDRIENDAWPRWLPQE